MENFGNTIIKKKNWHKRWWGIILIIFLTLILAFVVAIGFYFFDLVKNAQISIDGTNIKLKGEKYQLENNDNYWLGSANPKITIIEFADFACPYCKNSFTTIREIGLKYKNDVKIIFRDYPMHENSVELALAGRCAGEQGLFWLMHDKLFQNQGVETNEQLVELANQIGADIIKFNDCLVKQKYIVQIQKDFAAGEGLKINGTPTWLINGYKIEGDIPNDVFIKIIEDFLNS